VIGQTLCDSEIYILNHLKCANGCMQDRLSFELVYGFIRLSCEKIRQICKLADWGPTHPPHPCLTDPPNFLLNLYAYMLLVTCINMY